MNVIKTWSPAILFALVVSVPMATFAQSATFPGQDARDPQVLETLIESNRSSFLLIDVRTPAEYRGGHIPSADNIDYRSLESAVVDVDRGTPVVVYCRSGNRSARAARTLRDMGFQTVVDFGGLSRWAGTLETGES
jgi:rhodanese-related sulfurtransferase